MSSIFAAVCAFAVALHAAPALACKFAAPPAYDAKVGSTEPPPAVQIERVAVSLGRNYGEPGPGDCSDLGRVVITLRTDDGAVLDGRFGARLVVSAGRLPVTFVDLGSWIAAIQNNKIELTITDDRSSVDFTVAVQLTNAAGAAGPQSPTVRRTATADGSGCSFARQRRGAAVPLVILGALAMALRRRRPAARP